MAAIHRQRSRERLSRHRSKSALKKQFSSSSGSPMAQLGFAGSRHLVPDRLPTSRKETMVQVRAMDLSEETIRNIRNVASTLRRLDLNGLGLTYIAEECIELLDRLKRIDVSRNELTEDSFPECLPNLQQLIELVANYNQIEKLPSDVTKLRNLCRLKLGNNELKSTEGMEKLKRLVVLILENNSIDSLSKDFCQNMKRLEVFHIGNNRIKELTSQVRYMRCLKDLDISRNKLTSLPPEVFLLPQIDVLNASGNQISRLPSISVKGRVKRRLACIDMADNALIKFPEHLLLLSKKLDLSHNKIKTIPGTLLKKVDWDMDQNLSMMDNPMIMPPIEICGNGIRSILQFFQETLPTVKVYQGLKLLTIGPEMAGKTSLIQSLVDMQPRLAEEKDRTHGVDTYDLLINLNKEAEETQDFSNMKILQLSIWDFSGHPVYKFPNYIFLQQPSLVLLTFNMAEYKDEDFQYHIGDWLDWVLVKTNHLIVLPVGTHADKLKKNQIQEICQEVLRRIRSHVSSHVKSIQREIEKIENKPHISPALSEQLKSYIGLLKLQCKIHDEVIPLSSADLKGVEELQEAIVSIAENKEVFPNVLRQIPSLWVDVVYFLEEKGDLMQVPMLSWEEYQEAVTSKFGMKHLLIPISNYLHDTGKILWFSQHETLKNFVILRPTWLSDVLKALFRYDIADVDFSDDERARPYGMTDARLENFRSELVQNGIMDKEFVRYLWSNIIPTETTKPLMLALHSLLQHLEIGFSLTKPKSPERLGSAVSTVSRRSSRTGGLSRRPSHLDRAQSEITDISSYITKLGKDKDTDEDAPPMISRVLLPWLLHSTYPTNFREEYDKFSSNPKVVANYRFPRLIPVGFFEIMTVRSHAPKHGLKNIFLWNGGVYSQSIERHSRLYLRRLPHDDGSTCIRIEVAHEKNQVEDQAEDMWQLLLPFLKDVENLLSTFSGVRVERHVECPHCHTLSFMGEWQTPKELQSVTSRRCESCKHDVMTQFIIQPKEKLRVEEYLKKKIKEIAMKRAQEEAHKAQQAEMAEQPEEEEAEQFNRRIRSTVEPIPT